MKFKDKPFVNADYEVVPYDGSPITWRISTYAFITKANKVLLVRTEPNKYYDLPGGGVKIGESITQALKRETLEEAGVRIRPNKIIGYHQDRFYQTGDKKFYQTLLIYFSAKMTGNRIKPSDPRVVFADFVPLDKLSDYPLYNYIKKIIKSVK